MPVNLSHLQSDLSDRRDAAARRKTAATEDARSVLDTAKRQHRAHLTAGEDARVERLIELRDRADRELRDLDAGMAELAAVAADEAEQLRRSNESYPTPAAYRRPAYDQVARVGREARTYSPDTDPDGRSFLLDVARGMVFGDPGAVERLARHNAEERVERPGLAGYQQRAVPSGNFAGLVVPAYLTDLAAPAVAAMRPFADQCAHHDLPDTGMTINISRITTPTSVALQATENNAVATQDIDDTLLTENVQTAAGSVILSRQAVERGVLTEDVTVQDLLNRCATTLDSTLLNQASTGLSALASGTTTAYTTTQPTTAGLWPKLFAAQSTLETALLGQAPASHLIMAPRRWLWMQSQVASTWPTIGSGQVPPQMGGVVLTSEYGPGIRGVLSSGLKIVVDGNVITNAGAGTNQDEIYAVAARECHLFEPQGSAVMIRAEQPSAASLGILFVVYEYFAYTLRRYPGAVQSVTGTGLVTPVFA
jgi:hypothetical protein